MTAIQKPATSRVPAVETGDTWPAFIARQIDEHHSPIRALNDHIHANPELAYEEHKAHATFITTLTSLGFPVTPHAHGVETAFSSEFGSGGRLIIFNAEYDALPNIGHACGHNLIASSSLAAFIGVAAALKKSGLPGRVRLLGTPAEEGGGGKLHLIKDGAYRGAAASLMLHPGAGYLLTPPVKAVASVRMLANIKIRAYFTGREAHAAIEPWNGVNALDAACLSYTAISMLRQQIRPYERIHGVFRNGGDRPNVIPADCCIEYYVRSDTRAHAEALWERVQQCLKGAAISTGCELRIEPINSYSDLRPSAALCREFVDAMPEGTVSYDAPGDFLAGSTDMGNVTYECPGFHAAFGIEVPEGQGNHTKGFAAGAGTEDAYRRAMECAKGMAAVGWKVLVEDDFAERVQREWEEDMKSAAA